MSDAGSAGVLEGDARSDRTRAGETRASGPLTGLTLLEGISDGTPLCLRLAVGLAARIAADLGARVVVIEPDAGDPLRDCAPALPGGASALQAFLGRGKTIVRANGDAAAAARGAIARGVDGVFVAEGDPLRADARASDVCVVEIAGFPGRSDGDVPPLSEFTVMAFAGLLAMIGDPAREPLRLGGHQPSYAAGMAAFTAMAALLAGRDAGLPPDAARVSLVETMLWVNWKAVSGAQASGRAPSRKGAQAEFQVYRCADGWIALVFTATQLDALIRLVDDSVLREPRFATPAGRAANASAWAERLAPWFAARGRDRIYADAQALGVPLGPVLDAHDLLVDPQHVARGFVETIEDPALGTLRMPRLPVVWGDGTLGCGWAGRGEGAPPAAMRPQVVESARPSVCEPTSRAARETGLPLAGLRVVDFGQLTAGANTSAMLADLGADVIKIESPASLDLFRLIGAVDQAPGWWNRSPPFRFSNRNKRSVALDLKSDEGRRLARALIARSDVVVENFRRGVLERLGLDYATVRAENPRVVLASISSQGETGPNRLHASFGSTLDATGGLAALTGYPGEAPQVSGADVNYPDQVVSLISVGLVLAALREARRTGVGTRLDISQREVVSFMIGEALVAAGAGAAERERRRGNADADAWLQDCFRCADGRWVAVTVSDGAQARRLASFAGAGERVATDAGAMAPAGASAEPGGMSDPIAPVALHATLCAWCAARPAADAARALGAESIAAAPVLDGKDLLTASHLSGGSLATDADGALVKGMPYAFERLRFELRLPAPDLGEHTDAVLRDILGLDDAELARLRAAGVTRTEP